METTHWEEKFDQELAKFQKGDDAVAFTKDFIKTEIIEPLIADIPDNLIQYGYGKESDQNISDSLKQQLRDKWL